MPETANNFYGIHLTNFGENEEVIASEDIYNSQGVLLLKKGSFVNKKTADQIIKFKLLKPIESSVSIENSLQTDDLAADLKALFDTHPSLGLIHSTKQLHKPIRDYARKALNHPLLNQKRSCYRRLDFSKPKTSSSAKTGTKVLNRNHPRRSYSYRRRLDASFSTRYASG